MDLCKIGCVDPINMINQDFRPLRYYISYIQIRDAEN